MMKYLYIAEKPSTMQAVKQAYEKSSHPLGEITFVALAGHVCGLLEPKEYAKWKGIVWNRLDLPMIPDDFKVKPIKPDIVNKLDNLIKTGGFDGIIVGTDSDVEGNGIYALLEKMLRLENYKTLRFYETDLTDKGIMESFGNLTDFHTDPRDTGMTKAYWIRAKFDWLIGFNLSVAYSVKTNMLMRIGRVKAPTLKLVYDNCKAIDGHIKKSSYLPVICTDNPMVTATLVDENKKDKMYGLLDDAKEFVDHLNNKAVVREVECKTVKRPPQQLYKLSDIQVEAGQKYGYSPETTLNALQSLYEKHKVISYPRTDGRYISSEKAKEFSSLLVPLAFVPGMEDFSRSITADVIERVSKNKRFVNDDEVKKTSHDALIPTGKIPDFSKMSEEEKNICIMVYKRFLAIFLPDLVEEKKRVFLDVDNNLFISRGSVVKEKGFTAIFDTKIKQLSLPELIKGQELTITQKGIHEVVSQPPKRFTQALLVDAMENIYKYMDDKDLKDTMKEVKGIGQPSSRASIIQDLIKTGYIEEKGRGLYITESGKAYIHFLQGHSIVDPALSAQWEQHMQHIREGSETYDIVYDMMLSYVRETLQEVKEKELVPLNGSSHSQNQSLVDFNCPVCKKTMRKIKTGYGCSGYPDCHFFIGEIAHKELSHAQAKDLVEKGRTTMITGFISKNGKKFSARLVLNNGKISFDYPDRFADGKKTNLICPVCGSPLIKNEWGFRCSQQGCQFGVGMICGKKLTENQVKELLNKERLGPLTFKKKDGSHFDAVLILEPEMNGDAITGYNITFEKKKSMAQEAGDIYAKCPICGATVIRGKYGWVCSSEKHCTSVPYILCERQIEGNIAEVLFNMDQTPLLEGFVSKKNKRFTACLKMDESGKIKFIFP